MHTNCPQCSQKLVVEDDKIPAGPFMLRCPKCQNALKLPGKGVAAAPPPGAPQAEAGSPASPAGKAAPSQAKPPEPVPTTAPASPPLSAPATGSEEAAEGGNGRALVVLENQAVQSAVGTLLRRSGYGIDAAMEAQQGVQLLERNSYALVVTTPNGGSGPDRISLYKRVVALAPDARRNLFLVLLGSEFSSGDGTQAFSAMADLVLNPKDLETSEDLLRSTVAERNRIYRSFLDAQVRLDRRKY